MNMDLRRCVTVVVAIATCFGHSGAWARWPAQPDQFLELTARGRFVTPRSACSDGHGGAFVAWESQVPPGQFLQHVDANGDTLFADGPHRLSDQYGKSLTIVPDGEGGVVAFVHRFTPGDPISTLELTALGPAGAERWRSTVWSGRVGDSYYARAVVRDERVPGFVVTWVDANASPAKVRSQRFDGAGAPQWTEGGVVVLDDAPRLMVNTIAPDDKGGAWFLLVKYADTPSMRLCLCRVDASGAPVTPPSQEGLWSATAWGGTIAPGIVRDGFGGVYVSRYRSIASYGIERFRPDGSPAFGPYGLRIPGDQPLQEPFLGTGVDGRVFAGWQVWQGPAGWVTRAQLVDTTGTWAWPGDGIETGSGPAVLIDIPVFPDEAGGATLCVDSWADSLGKLRAAQRFSADGEKLWPEPPPGIMVASIEEAFYGGPGAFASTGDGGVLYFHALADSGDWQQLETNRLCAQRLDRYGRNGDTSPRILALGDVPDDAGGWLEVRWAASCLEGDSAMATVRYDVLRAQPGAAGSTEWVTVAEQPAAGLDEYVLTVPTLVDSIGPGAAPTSIRCRAVDAEGRSWESLVRVASSFPNPGALGIGAGAAGRLSLAPPAPCPATTSVLVRCSLPIGADGKLELFDTAGRRLRGVGLASGIADERSIPLELVDAGGRPLAAGLYLLRLRTGSSSLARRLVVLGAR